MKEQTIQTLHPEKGKKNKQISTEKYEQIKSAILNVLKHSEPTYTELTNELKNKLREKFEGNIGWYGVTVKLDLEARKIIERTKKKPATYRLK